MIKIMSSDATTAKGQNVYLEADVRECAVANGMITTAVITTKDIRTGRNFRTK